MFLISQYVINSSGLFPKETRKAPIYSIALGLVLYSSIYLYFLFYNNEYLTVFNKFIFYIIILDFLLSTFYYFSLQKDTNLIKNKIEIPTKQIYDQENYNPSDSENDSENYSDSENENYSENENDSENDSELDQESQQFISDIIKKETKKELVLEPIQELLKEINKEVNQEINTKVNQEINETQLHPIESIDEVSELQEILPKKKKLQKKKQSITL